MNRTRNLVLSGIGAFALGWLLVSFYGSVVETSVSVKETPNSALPRFGQASAGKGQPSRKAASDRLDFADYFLRIQGLRSTEECEACFAAVMEDSDLSQQERKVRMGMLLSKWGELSPRTAIQKIEEGEELWKIGLSRGMSPPWLGCVFSGWAGKDPEAAAAFFQESDDPRIKKDPNIPATLVGRWVEHSPQGAWDWLMAQEENSFLYYKACKRVVANSMLNHENRDRIPEFIAKMSEQDAKTYGPHLWKTWFWEHPDSPEQMASLSGENRTAAILGSISGKARGDMEVLGRELSVYSQEERQKFLFALAPGLLSGGKAEKERKLQWFMANAPGALLQGSVTSALNDWFLEKRAEAREVLDKLPPGKEKDFLMEAYRHPPIIE